MIPEAASCWTDAITGRDVHRLAIEDVPLQKRPIKPQSAATVEWSLTCFRAERGSEKMATNSPKGRIYTTYPKVPSPND